MSFKSVKVPSITGGMADKWKKWFCPGVTRYDMIDGRSIPVEGSVGVHYDVKGDIGAIFTTLEGNMEAFAAHLRVTMNAYRGAEGRDPAPEKNIHELMYFFEFASGDQPYFFLRKGTKTFGLYRKTRNYYYDGQELGCHRFGFEFVRLATEEERNSVKLGARPVAILEATARIPVEPTLAEVMASLAKVRGAVANLAADLDAAFSRFNKALE